MLYSLKKAMVVSVLLAGSLAFLGLVYLTFFPWLLFIAVPPVPDIMNAIKHVTGTQIAFWLALFSLVVFVLAQKRPAEDRTR